LVEVRIPDDFWDADLQGTISTWIYESGAQVSQGEVIAETLVEKATKDLLAPASGRLVIKVRPEELIRAGDLVAVIE